MTPPGGKGWVGGFASPLPPQMGTHWGDPGATIATRGIGAQANEVTTSEFYNKFADLDAPTSWIQSSDRKPTPRSMRRATHSRRVFRPSSAGG